MERMYYHTQQQGVTGVRAMSPAGGSDPVEQGGKSQRRGTILRRETLIERSESPQEAQKHVPRYMHTCTGPGALALADLQDQQGPARAARGRARPGPAVYKCRSKSTTLETAPSPEGQGTACSSRSPRICICHTFLGALPAFSVSPQVPEYSVTARHFCRSCFGYSLKA